jgi:hypothetical protein
MAESQSTDAGKPGKIAATFITNGAVQAAEVTVAREGDRVALDITATDDAATADHHLLFEDADALDLIKRVAGMLAHARRVELNAG